MEKLVVLKLGGSVVTRKREGLMEVNVGNLSRLAKEISEAILEAGIMLVVVHGAGPFGHVPAKEHGLSSGSFSEKKRRGFSLTRQSMEKLNSAVVDALIASGVNAVSFQPSAVGCLRDGKLSYFPTKILKDLLSLGLVPVAYGDVLFDEEHGARILSGDSLAPYLASELEADRVVFAADVDGVFDRDPGEKDSTLIREITAENFPSLRVGGSKGTDVTGGMKRKLSELVELADEGIESEIVSGVNPGVLKRALCGEKNLGTLIRK